MRRFVRVGLACGLAASLSSCAHLLESKEARESRERCEALKTVPISFEEEVSFGGAMTMGLVVRGSGLGLEVEGTLEELRTKNELELPASPMNDVTRYVALVGKNLALQSSRPTLPWTFGVIDADEVNAFSAPGGYVMVTRGLLRKVENEAQLAGVLAHEIAHVTERHALDTYREYKAAECMTALRGQQMQGVASMVGAGVGQAMEGSVSALAAAHVPMDTAGPIISAMARSVSGAMNLNDPANLPFLKFITDKAIDEYLARGVGPKYEFDADKVAFSLLVNAGYNPNEFTRFLEKVQESGEVFPTHPPRKQRQDALEAYKNTLKDDPFLGPDHPFENLAVPVIKDELAWTKK
ncbi:MAG TPA: M48 family metallopeptidase [Myxococcaceae bacterium]|nr:M48 family metallopeptidase [Myxococcaceae bacterium]